MKLRRTGGRTEVRVHLDRGRTSDDSADAFWLGGEAMIAPACAAALRDAERLVAEEYADPTWLEI